MLKSSLINRSGPFRPIGTPVLDIRINEQKVKNWISFRVELNGLGAVDSFDVTLPWEVTDETPVDPLLFSGPKKAATLVKGGANIKISAGFKEEGALSPLIEGPMDRPVWDFDAEQGEVVTVYGRSYGAKPFDYKETVKYQNHTSTAAFKAIAKKHGLTPVVPVETHTLIGSYSKEDHVNVQREVSHWDFVLYLCQQEGFTTRVWGKNWFFGPREKLPGYLKPPIPFTWGHNIDRPFRIERAPNAARNLIVEVISWIPGKPKPPKRTKKGKPITKPAKGEAKGQRIVEKASFVGSSFGHKYTMRYYFPNLTRDQCQRKARAILQQLSSMQLYGSFRTDWWPELANDRRIALFGVGQTLSQVYFCPKIIITGSKTEGIRTEITFTNLPLEEEGRFG